jgi:hypothetical protein
MPACLHPLVLLALAGGANAADPLDVTLDAARIAAMPHEAVDATVHAKLLHCSGVPLASVLRMAGAMPTDPPHGAHLARVVRVTARDGYRVAFSMAELDPTLGNARVFVVDACDGKPLDEHDGPLRLLVPGDARPARGIRQLQSIVVADAP